jgi:hypothetical protein
MDADALLAAHRELWRTAFSPAYVAKRMARAVGYLRPGALLMASFMNSFYGWKRLRGNEPVDMGMGSAPNQLTFCTTSEEFATN